MEKDTIEQLLSNERITSKEKLDILYKEYNAALLQSGYFKEKADYLEGVIEKINEDQQVTAKSE
ncbi:hypothetical protein [Bacillus bombysepticus]|uniref:hypothetical protein n=1 Tax=Bacillus bombysepticus TaxID=658666 RepID=UPI00301B2B99